MKTGFESLNYIRVEGDETGVRVRVNGENVRDFSFLFIQGTEYVTTCTYERKIVQNPHHKCLLYLDAHILSMYIYTRA